MVSAISSPSLTVLLNDAQNGMRGGIAKVDGAAKSIASGEADPGSFVDLLVGQRTYEMNAKVLKTGDEMLGTLINVLA